MKRTPIQSLADRAMRLTSFLLAFALLSGWLSDAGAAEAAQHIVASATTAPATASGPRAAAARRQEPLISGPWSLDDYVGDITLFVGETRVFKKPSVARLAVGNGQVLSAAVTDDNEILLIANAAGTSVLHIWSKDGRSVRLKITIIESDIQSVARDLAKFLSTMPNVRSSIVGDKVLVEGTDLSNADRAKLAILSKRYPQVINFTGEVGWERMIYMDIKVVEFKKDKLRDIGVVWDKEINGPGAAVVGDVLTNKLFNLRPSTGLNGALPAKISPFQSYFGIVTELNSRLRLSQSRGDSVILAQPKIAARSGSDAEFSVGGEIPYAVITNQTSTIEWKPYGLKFKISPVMDNGESVKSKLDARISAIDPSVTTPGGLPALVNRQLTTEFNVRVGETMVLAGLLDRRKASNGNLVPGLNRIPILGQLFQNNATEERDTELVIFVTPMVYTDAGKDAQALRSLTEDKDRLLGQVRLALDPPEPATPSEPPKQERCILNDGLTPCS